MKWEILKGSEKDFDGAPEWATISYKYGCSDLIRFCNGWNHGCKFSGMREEMTRHYGITDLSKYKVIAERRPITEPVVNQQVATEWSGEGFPPVGVECEFSHLNRSNPVLSWDRGVVKYLSEHAIVIEFTDPKNGCAELMGLPLAMRFRPIRSPEDAARDRAFSDLEELEKTMPDGYQPYELLDAIVLAGYRKVE